MNTDNHDALLIVLLDRIAHQDEAALKALYDQCASKLYGLALRVVPQRELAEEAGLFSLDGLQLQAAGRVRTSRLEPQGWHDEFVHVFNLTLAADFVPQNQDGEVAEFMCLSPQQVLARMRAGAFTVDAVQTLVQGLR